MPILAPEPSVFPESLFAGGHPEEARCWVLHTRPRQEKCVARHLYQQQRRFYLPLVERRQQLRGRIVTAHLPLFAGYLFVWGNDSDRLAALASRRLAAAIPVNDTATLWSDLEQVCRLISLGVPMTPEDRLAPGTEVVIRSGALAGIRGRILRQGTQRRFVVVVDFIQRGAAVELDDFMLEALSA